MRRELSVNVERILICPERGAPQLDCEHISVKIDRGIEGDRNFGKSIHSGQNLALIEAEEIELFCKEHAHVLDLSIFRRNLVTRGVKLNEP